ncbi:10943_t:CDS:2 [Cetraspora pellucida]|uniref:10943_t:CDS:1 n=1 Tax=Cetraspora pellucida TaxID=1433469 RepID=A0A9N9F7Y6_9GLOM|nr:10943_t:CDS:2 [Cetraspora pellucida]
MESSNTNTLREYNFMSRETFNNILTEFIQSKDSKYQNVTVISCEHAEKCIKILENPDNNELKNSSLYKWIKKNVLLMRIGDEKKLIKKKDQKEICLKEDLYDYICAYYQMIGHELYHQNYICKKDISENIVLEIKLNIEIDDILNNDTEFVNSNSEIIVLNNDIKSDNSNLENIILNNNTKSVNLNSELLKLSNINVL